MTADGSAIKERPHFIARPRMGQWRGLANCRGIDPDLMFPGQGESANPAKQVCAGCVVRWECLSYSIEAREKFGVWGQVGERNRRQLRVWLHRNPGTTLEDALVALDVAEWREDMAIAQAVAEEEALAS